MMTRKTKKGFTLIEMLVAVAVFGIFLTSIVTVLVDIYRSARRIALEEQIYEDLRVMATQLTKMLENNTIDYEEYYRHAMGGEYLTQAADPAVYSYGDYAKLFYDFGTDSAPGALCNDNLTPANSLCVINKTTIDKKIGINPYKESFGAPETANAFCGPGTVLGPCMGSPVGLHRQSQLYLINERGDKKTILSLEPLFKNVDGVSHTEKVLSYITFDGTDTDSDDVTEVWTPGAQFVVDPGIGGLQDLNVEIAVPKDISRVYEGFTPLSPMRTRILDIQFYITPLEDPYKAFGETDPAVGTLIQPHVTVVMTVEPSASELTNYLGPIPRQTIQTTIYSKVVNEVRSY